MQMMRTQAGQRGADQGEQSTATSNASRPGRKLASLTRRGE